MDDIDRRLLALLQQDATLAYATLGQAVGLSAGAVHERVRKLRERGIIRSTTVDVDPSALGLGILAFVLIESNAWLGERSTADALAAIPEVCEAHVVAGSASILVKIRTTSTENLQVVLKKLFEIDGVTGTHAILSLETFFERPAGPPTER
ncbi:Lrp/AsnC family transcriptional regulator [Amycolatopsis anabasis]|uniref:Lrp/AsnC family transcriptional regulator n=1 Tax=Amycolatopsis anabasis TaxID=1840409 RepID=UPI00131DB96C|nr:Lrp/AsnC family transcriptional regulator [Amycolatopsis anabasis]